MKERLFRVLTSLTAKYVALFVLLVAVPSIGISWYLLNSSYNDNKSALIREQQAEATALAGRIDQTILVLADRLRSMQGQGLSSTRARVRPPSPAVSGLTPLTAFYVNRHGISVAAVGREEFANLSRGAFERAGTGMYIGRIHRVTPPGSDTIPVFTLATPENFGGGVMAMVLPGETFQSIFADAHRRVEVMPTRLRGLTRR